ncbi:hypothetical protein L209DRAFT_748477 [Thermothelomyces heterothallicus CBS 203.75]
MPEQLQPLTAPIGPDRPDRPDRDHDTWRLLSRSPHPYHRLNSELFDASDHPTSQPITTAHYSSATSAHPFPAFARDSPISESGTEADDEHFLKGLPAPKTRPHKGLRGRSEQASAGSTPLLSPAVLEEEGRELHASSHHGGYGRVKRGAAERACRRKELIRRATEVLLVVGQGAMVASSTKVWPFLRLYQREFIAVGGLFCGLAVAYPLRLVAWAYRQGKKPRSPVPLRIPATFDPSPVIYPPLVPVIVSLLIAENVNGAVLPSLVLSICTLPRPLVPGARDAEYYSGGHWLLSCLPFTLGFLAPTREALLSDGISREVLVLLYPLHQTLCLVLHQLTTTSLLVSELQLLSAALISLLLLARSPQAVILKALLWGGGLGLAVSCGQVIQWGISLARVPKWRFKQDRSPAWNKSLCRFLWDILPLQRARSGSAAHRDGALSDTDRSVEEYLDGQASPPLKKTTRSDSVSDVELTTGGFTSWTTVHPNNTTEPSQQSPSRRHTVPATGKPIARAKSTTPSGRRKRATSSSVRAFFSLTQAQATARKWLYAGYLYLCILLVILVGIRLYVQKYALSGQEPLGWALAYLFGDIPQFRFQVVNTGLERWIPLPPLLHTAAGASCRKNGWVDRTRLLTLGGPTTRLFLSAYWLFVILTGLAVVFRLSPVCEVDTRRKVFHFMMVAMFLPTTYVDPCYVALALALMLAIFLVLDLVRASQLPPLSRPIAKFLTPYVDGRDLRGPVVVSHMFLLIGCAIPLWLSLAAIPRSAEGDGAPAGWEVPTRDVGMVAGVVCVGLGDAAASLVGRRWGHRRWLWGGGKSLEGSAAFALAVFGGLMSAALWLRVGGWPVTPSPGVVGGIRESGTTGSGLDSLVSVLDPARLWPWLRAEVPKTAVCASLASMTEAVLTGGNDNVIVPVVLWGCVKSLGL